MNVTFKAVLDLKTHTSLFQWTSVSNIPDCLLGKAIDIMKKHVCKLENAPSSEKISELTKACTTFRVALAAYRAVKQKQPKPSQNKK
jgi:hypothetical protein